VRNTHDPPQLLARLLQEPRENEWLEFKENKFTPDNLGEYISGLSNSAILAQHEYAYLVYGVEDHTRNIVGTSVRLNKERIGNEPLENWLNRLLHPSINFDFIAMDTEGLHVEIVIITPTYMMPVRFKSNAYIRVNQVLKLLRDFPERERAIWNITSRFKFEQGVSASNLKDDKVFELLFCDKLAVLMELKKTSKSSLIDHFLMEGFLIDNKQGGFDATNLFAIIAARDLKNFPTVAKKAPRVVTYQSNSKMTGVDDVTGTYGYGIAFLTLIRYIAHKIPHSEHMSLGNRVTVYKIPFIAIRELVANALIHQDFTSVGDGPLIEIYKDRLRISNPGKPLISPDRFIDAPPKSRNEKLAAITKRLGYCEERGSGIDRAIEEIEKQTLRAPLFQEVELSTVVTVYQDSEFKDMSKEERIRACYQHSCLRFERGLRVSNASLRARFGMTDKQSAQASIVIRDAIAVGLVRPVDEDQPNRNARYVPFWA
jgi:predicted HTH transcriptional regulator